MSNLSNFESYRPGPGVAMCPWQLPKFVYPKTELVKGFSSDSVTVTDIVSATRSTRFNISTKFNSSTSGNIACDESCEECPLVDITTPLVDQEPVPKKPSQPLISNRYRKTRTYDRNPYGSS